MDNPPRPGDAPRGERIAKLLARAGVASRREIERMIADGRVAHGGDVLASPATLLPSLDGITVDGAPVAAAEATRLFVFHKPAGVLTAERDFSGRRTIYDVLPRDLPRLVPVGRLDLNTEGLLLLTNDGGLKRALELPATGVERSYRARVYGHVTQDQLESLIEGVTVDGVHYGSIDANIERRTGANFWIEMVLREGKNREVRRVLDHLGLSTSRLIRTRYGPFILGDMPEGGVGEVRAADLAAFQRTLAGPRTGGTTLPPIRVTASGAVAAPARPRSPRAPAPAQGRGGEGAIRSAPARPAPVRPSGGPRPAPAAPPRSAASPARGASPAPSRADTPKGSPRTPPVRATSPVEAPDAAPKARSPRPPQRKAGWARPKPKAGPPRRPGGGKPRQPGGKPKA